MVLRLVCRSAVLDNFCYVAIRMGGWPTRESTLGDGTFFAIASQTSVATWSAFPFWLIRLPYTSISDQNTRVDLEGSPLGRGDVNDAPGHASYSVSGLEAPVEILIDSWGVPHIYASSTYDAFFAQGFTLHATGSGR